MQVGVRLAAGIIVCVLVLVMIVMHMGMGMFHRLVPMVVFVVFGQMQPNPGRHQDTSQRNLPSQRFIEADDRNERAKERRGREISSRSRAPEMTQGQHKADQANAIAEKANQSGGASDRHGWQDAPSK